MPSSTPPDPDSVRSQLTREVLRGTWDMLRQHHTRGALFVVVPEFDLVEVGLSAADDEALVLGAWLRSGDVRRLTPDEVEALEATPTAAFSLLIVQPYVFAQTLRVPAEPTP